MGKRQLYEITYFRNSAEKAVSNKAIMSLRQLQRLKKIPWVTIDSYEKVDNCTEKEVDILPV